MSSSANIPFEDLLVLNCRSEIGFLCGFAERCSTLAYKNIETGKQLLAQTWDWQENQQDNIIVLDITYLDGTRIITITEAGIVGNVGFNGDCVGVTFNGLITKDIPLDYSMLPIHFALRYIILESPSAGEAINRLMRIGVASTGHFLIADSISAYGVELSPLGNGIIQPDTNGLVLHTNHWISTPLIVKSDALLSDTFTRLERLKSRSLNIKTAEDIWEVMADKDIIEGTYNKLETLCTVVMDLESGMGELVYGKPTKGKQRALLPRMGPMGNAGNDVKRQSMR